MKIYWTVRDIADLLGIDKSDLSHISSRCGLRAIKGKNSSKRRYTLDKTSYIMAVYYLWKNKLGTVEQVVAYLDSEEIIMR